MCVCEKYVQVFKVYNIVQWYVYLYDNTNNCYEIRFRLFIQSFLPHALHTMYVIMNSFCADKC